MADTPIWKRLPSDTDKSFEAFVLYRDMGASRSLEKLRQKLAKESPNYKRVLQKWSSDFNWQERVAAFDASLDEKNLDENAERQKRIKDNAYSDYLVLREAIENFKENYKRTRFVGVPAYEVSNLVGLMKQADDYARRAVGLPDKITEAKNEDKVSGDLTIRVVYDDKLPGDK
jgi:hypothetical protein